MTADISERGLGTMICTALTGSACDPETRAAGAVGQRPPAYGAAGDSEEMADAG